MAKTKTVSDYYKPWTPSADLAKVVGAEPLARTEITKRLWAYIKKHGLQDTKLRRFVNADDNLKAVFGGKTRVSMFEITKLVNRHISQPAKSRAKKVPDVH